MNLVGYCEDENPSSGWWSSSMFQMDHYSSDCMVSLIVGLPLSILMCTSHGTANPKHPG
jgi:ABC-type proline/glycine betaine transport system permease subunit